MNLMKIPSREIWKNKKRSRKWIVTVSSRALEEKLEKTRREDGFRFLSLFFHFGPLFFAPLSPPVIYLSLSLYHPCFFCVPPAPSTSLWTFFYDFLIPVKVHTKGAKLKDKRTYHFARRSTQTWQVAPVWRWLEFSLTSFFFSLFLSLPPLSFSLSFLSCFSLFSFFFFVSFSNTTLLQGRFSGRQVFSVDRCRCWSLFR